MDQTGDKNIGKYCRLVSIHFIEWMILNHMLKSTAISTRDSHSLERR